MKKSKVFALTILSVILCLMIMCTSSFSWFTRGTQTGGYFSWSNNGSSTALSYNSTNGEGISMATYPSPDGKTYGDDQTEDFGKSVTLSAGERNYYRTDISNSSSADQSVSLYLANLQTSNTGDFYLGVNDPLKTYKNYSNNEAGANKVKSTINRKNVYVGIVESQSPNISDFKVHYWTQNVGNKGDETVNSTQYGGSVKNYTTTGKFNNYNANYKMYIATIPYSADAMVLQKSGTYFDGGDNTDIKTNNTILWFHYDSGFHTYNAYSGTAAGINTFYSDATVKVGQTLSIQADCMGESIQYESSNNDIVTVDNNGTIKGISPGTAKVTVKSYGIYTDCITAECTVTVGSPNNEIPVVTNIKVPAKSGDKDSVVSVYWYIKNDSDGESLTYKVDDIYISL